LAFCFAPPGWKPKLASSQSADLPQNADS
jgi:hypothetical protein